MFMFLLLCLCFDGVVLSEVSFSVFHPFHCSAQLPLLFLDPDVEKEAFFLWQVVFLLTFVSDMYLSPSDLATLTELSGQMESTKPIS